MEKNSLMYQRNLKKQRSIHDYLYFKGYRFNIGIETLIFIILIFTILFIAISSPSPNTILTV